MPTITINECYYSNFPITCILGVLDNDAGRSIQVEMCKWIGKKYNIIIVKQATSGTLFEYPAIRFAQWYSITHNEPVLYLHTKGAANQTPIQKTVRRMWMFEFSQYYQWYCDNAIGHTPFIGCPFTDGHSTWFNGWIANSAAFQKLDTVTISLDRYVYETGLWGKSPDVQVIGRLLNDATFDNLSQMWDIVNIFKQP